jgi:hypothetical protein
VHADLSLWEIQPGSWRFIQNTDDGNEKTSGQQLEKSIDLKRGDKLKIRLEPRKKTILSLKLESAGRGMWEYPDLGISKDDIEIHEEMISVMVHSLGSKATSETEIQILDMNGQLLGKTTIPSMEAPYDLFPRSIKVEIPFSVEAHTRKTQKRFRVVVDPEDQLEEISEFNNSVFIPYP